MATTISSGRANSPKLTANIADHGTIYGGRGLKFDGVSDYLNYNARVSTTDGDDWSLSAWVSPLSNKIGTIWGQSHGGYGVQLIVYDDGAVYLQWRDNGNSARQVASGQWAVTVGNWTHITATWESQTKVVLYINGKSVAEHTTTADIRLNSVGDRDATTRQEFLDQRYPNIIISDVKRFDTALTEAQVQELYLKPEQSAPSAVQANLKQWFPMCEGNPDSPQSIVYDHSEKKFGTQKFNNSTFDGDLTYWLTTGTNTTQSYNSSTGHMRQVVTADNGYWFLHWNQPHTFSDFGLFEAKVHFVSGNPFQVKFQLRDAAGTYHNKYSPELSSVGDSYHLKYYINGIGSYGDQRFYLTNAENGDTVDWEFVKFTPINMGNHATTNFFGDELHDSTWVNSDMLGFASASATGFTAVNTDSGQGNNDNAYGKQITFTAGKTYKIAFTITANSGVALPVIHYGVNSAVTGDTNTTQANVSGAGSNSMTFTPSSTLTNYYPYVRNGANAVYNYTISDYSIKEVGISSSGFATADSEPTIPQVPLMRYNEKMLFDGFDDDCYLDLGASAFGTGDQTLSAWFNASDLTGTQAIFGAMHYNAASSFGHGFLLNSTTLHGVAGEGASTVYDNLTSATLSVGKTYHAVFVRDATNNYYYLYVNGALADSYSSSIDPRFNDTYDKWMMGRSGNASEKGKYFQGTIDECSVFNTALSNTEVQELFNDGVALDATTHSKAGNLMGYWRNDGISSWSDRRGWSYLSFDGTNDYVEISDSDTLDQGTNDFTVSFWHKSDAQHDQPMLNKKATFSDNTAGWTIYMENGANQMRCRIGGGSSNVAVSAGTVAVNDESWHLTTMVRSGDNLYLYTDGSQEGSTTGVNSLNVDNSEPLYIARSASLYPACEIAQVAIYDIALTTAQVLAQYNNGVNSNWSSDSNLVGYWKLDSASTVIDLSSNSNNGTVSGATLNTGNNGTPAGTPDAITIREGLNSNKDGLGFPFKNDDRNVLRLDGVSEYLLIPKTAGLDMSGGRTFTMSCWFKLESYKSYPMLMSYGDPTTGHEESSLYVHTGNNTIGWGNQHGDADFANASGATISLNTWYMATVTFNGSTTIKIYVNDALDGTKSDCTNVAITHDPIYIGKRANGLPFNGMIDEARVYNRELSLAEIQKNYKHGKGKHKN